MADDQHYDVVIIGTGAGGGTLGHRLASERREGALAGARAVPAPRARQLEQRGGVRPRQVPRARGLVRPARPRVPARGQLLRRGQHQVLRRRAVPAAAGGLRRAAPPRWDLAGLADLATTTWSPTTPKPSTSTWCTASTGRTRPRARPARIRLPAGVPRTAHPAAERRPGEAGAAPLPPADRGQPPGGRARPGRPDERLHPLRPGRRLPVPAGRQVRLAGHLRGPGAVPGQRHAGHRRQCPAAGDRRLRADGHRGRHHAGRRIRSPPSPATSWWSPAAR